MSRLYDAESSCEALGAENDNWEDSLISKTSTEATLSRDSMYSCQDKKADASVQERTDEQNKGLPPRNFVLTILQRYCDVLGASWY
ncbi:MAG: hypothetical protein M1818_000689 [Claussenomyces sp. TS43310]|nr:MAG: hypothetical protein M1818_000689 [Claussenomyces sp. TS43310]